MSKINVDGVILDDEGQHKLYQAIEVYMQHLKDKAAVEILMKECLADVGENIHKDMKKYVKNAATQIWKAEAGKLDLERKNDEEAAVEQCREIHAEHAGN